VPQVPVENNQVTIPSYLIPLGITFLVFLMAGWVSSVASDEAKRMDDIRGHASSDRFRLVENLAEANENKIIVLENQLENISHDVEDARVLADENHDLLIRIATKLEVHNLRTESD